MPLSSLLTSATGTCPLCRQKAGILSREHPKCRRAHQVGCQQMVHIAAVGGKAQQSANLAQM